MYKFLDLDNGGFQFEKFLGILNPNIKKTGKNVGLNPQDSNFK